jgi:hypothetical protein
MKSRHFFTASIKKNREPGSRAEGPDVSRNRRLSHHRDACYDEDPVRNEMRGMRNNYHGKAVFLL